MFYRRFDLSRDCSIRLLEKAVTGQLRFATFDRFSFELRSVQRQRPEIEFHVINGELLTVGLARDYEGDDACRVLSCFAKTSRQEDESRLD